jgi:hypothetical protein
MPRIHTKRNLAWGTGHLASEKKIGPKTIIKLIPKSLDRTERSEVWRKARNVRKRQGRLF